jgi:hypothetical protein
MASIRSRGCIVIVVVDTALYLRLRCDRYCRNCAASANITQPAEVVSGAVRDVKMPVAAEHATAGVAASNGTVFVLSGDGTYLISRSTSAASSAQVPVKVCGCACV